MRQAGNAALMRDRRDAYRVFVGKPAEKRQLGRPRRRRADDIKMVLQQVGCRGGGPRNGSSWFRIGTGGGGDSCKRGNEPSGSIKCGEFLD